MDLAHHTSGNEMTAVIVLFWKMSNRQNISMRKKKQLSFTLTVIDIKACKASQQNIDGDNSNNPISRKYINESLTR